MIFEPKDYFMDLFMCLSRELLERLIIGWLIEIDPEFTIIAFSLRLYTKYKIMKIKKKTQKTLNRMYRNSIVYFCNLVQCLLLWNK